MRKNIFFCSCLLLSTLITQAQARGNYNDFLDDALNSFGKRATKVNEEYKIGKYERWDFNQDTGELIFSSGNTPKVIATAQIVGSYFTHSKNWMWSWANKAVDDAVKKDMGKIKEYGERNQFKELTTAQWVCEENYAWQMTAVAGYLLKGKSAYRVRIPNGYIYLLITDIKWAVGAKN